MRRHKFPKIQNLDNELDLIVQSIKELTGKKVETLPPLSQTPEMARFIKKVSSTKYEEYIKIDGAYRLLNKCENENSYSGVINNNSFLEMRVYGGYIQWRDNPNGNWIDLISITELQGEPGTIEDGDKGDITVSNNGSVFTINSLKITEEKIDTNAITESKIKDNEVSEVKLKLSDNTIGDVSTTRHGFMPKLPNDPNKFLNGVGNWVEIDISALIPLLFTLGLSAEIGLQIINFITGDPVIKF